MRVELVAVGTELLLGDIVNSNAAWLGARLAEAGLDVTTSVVVGDNDERIAAAVGSALDRADAVVVTGGLGPTQDDRTREALARVAGVPLRRDEGLEAALLARFRDMGRRAPERNLRQADLPEGASPLPNLRGTAPGLRVPLPGGVVYALPGVPHEMEAMFGESVLPDLLTRAGEPATIVSRVLRTVGMWESEVAEALADLHEQLERAGNPTLAWLASGGMTRVRISAKAPDRPAAEALIEPVAQVARQRLGEAVYGEGDDTLDVVVHRMLRERGATVAVAESLTGGLLGAMLTDMPGASETFRGGVVVYATDLKGALADVPGPLLAAEGAVSADVAAAMAAGVRRRLSATYGVGVTGVAGPDRQDGQPVGTTHVAVAAADGGQVRSLRLPGDRPRIRTYAAVAALDLLRRTLLQEGRPPGSR